MCVMRLTPDRKEILTLTAGIVGSYVQNNGVAADDLTELISKVFDRLLYLGYLPLEAEDNPAVPVERSVSDTFITCLECGKPVTILKRHLKESHGMTAEEYRIKWGLEIDYPVVAPAYAKKRSEIAKSFGLGLSNKKRQRQKVRKKPGK